MGPSWGCFATNKTQPLGQSGCVSQHVNTQLARWVPRHSPPQGLVCQTTQAEQLADQHQNTNILLNRQHNILLEGGPQHVCEETQLCYEEKRASSMGHIEALGFSTSWCMEQCLSCAQIVCMLCTASLQRTWNYCCGAQQPKTKVTSLGLNFTNTMHPPQLWS